MRPKGLVSSEGGPRLFIDAGVASEWLGADEDGGDYERACGLLEAEPAREGGEIETRHGGHGIVWEMGGAGSAEVFTLSEDASGFAVVRTWPMAADGMIPEFAATETATSSTQLGTLEVKSGFMARRLEGPEI